MYAAAAHTHTHSVEVENIRNRKRVLGEREGGYGPERGNLS
jgi:hypothetical protein